MNHACSRRFAFLSILFLVVPFTGRAADSTGTTPPASDSHSPAKHHRHKKKLISDAAIGKSTETVTHVGVGAGNIVIPGMSNDNKAGEVGSPNMGSPDHTPGTTGTSGQ